MHDVCVPDAFVRGIYEKRAGRFSLGVFHNRLFDAGGFLYVTCIVAICGKLHKEFWHEQ
jgi:hypothetical protein